MKKICILSSVNLKHMSLITLYTQYLDQNNITYDIIYVDKYNEIESNTAEHVYRFKMEVNREWSLWKKLRQYFKFKLYAEKILRKNKYDFIIVWNSFTALMFYNILTFKYKGRYSFNIRDYAKEKNKMIFKMMRRLTVNSAFNTISSEKFKTFLPDEKYITLHSINTEVTKGILKNEKLHEKTSPIKITFIGYVRFFNQDIQMIESLKNDSRFLLQYIGEGSQVLKNYAEKNGIYNIHTLGRFDVKETSNFINHADIINNVYGTNTPGLKSAISIKFYYSLYREIPILVSKGTYMEEVATEAGNSITIADNNFEDMGNYLYEKYNDINQVQMKSKIHNYIEKIEGNNKLFNEYLEKYIK